MSCRDALKKKEERAMTAEPPTLPVSEVTQEATDASANMLFGVSYRVPSSDHLQNNIDLFEWVCRNKLYPNFVGRYLTGRDCLTREEIAYLHRKGCKIAALYTLDHATDTEEAGVLEGKKIALTALELGIPEGSALFLEVKDSNAVKTEFMKGLAKTLTEEHYTPGIKANTDAKFAFDREFSRGMQTDSALFAQYLIWAEAPILEEYNGMTTSHLLYPDNWTPFAPSGKRRKDIAVWQYGKDCHPIYDDSEREIRFDLNLICLESVLIEKMF